MAVTLAVLSASLSSIFVRLATAQPLVIAFYRLAFTVLLQSIPLLLGSRHERMSRRDTFLSSLSGLFLAAHFASWFFSLRLTTVASSTVLVSTHPFIVMAVGNLFGGERIGRGPAMGLGVAVLGAALVGWGDYSLDTRALWGDALALTGAVTVACYMLIGREVRRRAGALIYSTTAYASAAVALLSAALLAGNQFTGFEPVNWLLFAGLAVFPTILGHTVFNWALKYLPATVVSVTILGEPIGASFLAWVLWRSMPGPLSLAGVALLLAGIALFLTLHRPETAKLEGAVSDQRNFV